MRRLISKETGLLILAGFTLFFLMAQISIFQVSFHVGDSSVTFSHGERTTARLFPETRAFVNGKSYDTINTVYKHHIFVTLLLIVRQLGC